MGEAEEFPAPEALTTGCALLFLAVTNTCFRLLEPVELQFLKGFIINTKKIWDAVFQV